jgi:hypothetical protein
MRKAFIFLSSALLLLPTPGFSSSRNKLPEIIGEKAGEQSPPNEQSPLKTPPKGATALCNDLAYSTGTGREACRRDNGVKCWVKRPDSPQKSQILMCPAEKARSNATPVSKERIASETRP